MCYVPLLRLSSSSNLVQPSDPDAYQGPWDEETMAPYRVIFLTSYGDPNEEFLAGLLCWESAMGLPRR